MEFKPLSIPAIKAHNGRVNTLVRLVRNQGLVIEKVVQQVDPEEIDDRDYLYIDRMQRAQRDMLMFEALAARIESLTLHPEIDHVEHS